MRTLSNSIFVILEVSMTYPLLLNVKKMIWPSSWKVGLICVTMLEAICGANREQLSSRSRAFSLTETTILDWACIVLIIVPTIIYWFYQMEIKLSQLSTKLVARTSITSGSLADSEFEGVLELVLTRFIQAGVGKIVQIPIPRPKN